MMFNNIKIEEEIRLGDIWMCDLGIPNPNDISNKNVQAGKRPCLINSNDDNNLYAPTVNLIPLTKQLHKVYPMHKIIGVNCGLKVPSYILPEQATTKNKNVLLFKIGHCDDITMKRVQDGILIQQGMKGIYENHFNNVKFNKNRVFKMIQMIDTTKKLIKNETRSSILNILQDNLEIQMQELKAYCFDFNQNINDYYDIKRINNEMCI